MIKLTFIINRETFRIFIKGREIFYGDRKWRRMIRLIPPDEEFMKKIVMSRNQIPSQVKELFNLTEEEQKEYDNAETEEELAEICIRDSKKKGGSLLKKEIE